MSDEFALYEALLWGPPSGYFLLEYHLQRLQRPAAHFRFAVDVAAVLINSVRRWCEIRLIRQVSCQ